MSLIERMSETLTKMSESRTSDGEGGYTAVWSEGDTFRGAVSVEAQEEVSSGAKDTSHSTYVVTTKEKLLYNDTLKRENGEYLRVKSSGERKSPAFCGFGEYYRVRCEGWKI